MGEIERTIGELRIKIDRDLCVGFGDCVEQAPDAFRLDDEGLATFANPQSTERDRLVAACEECPVDALTVWNAEGEQIVP